MEKFIKMYRVHYEELVGDVIYERSPIYTTLEIPEVHKYLESKFTEGKGKVNILNYDYMDLLVEDEIRTVELPKEEIVDVRTGWTRSVDENYIKQVINPEPKELKICEHITLKEWNPEVLEALKKTKICPLCEPVELPKEKCNCHLYKYMEVSCDICEPKEESLRDGEIDKMIKALEGLKCQRIHESFENDQKCMQYKLGVDHAIHTLYKFKTSL